MAIAIDASSLINLSNAAALEIVFSLPDCEFLICPVVAGECHAECVAEIMRLRAQYRVTLVQDRHINAEVYLNLLETYELGEGETECIALCASSEHLLCCDDRKARNIAANLLGPSRIIGSLRLLKWTVEIGRTNTDNAYEIYQTMKSAGGFLPNVEKIWFST